MIYTGNGVSFFIHLSEVLYLPRTPEAAIPLFADLKIQNGRENPTLTDGA